MSLGHINDQGQKKNTNHGSLEARKEFVCQGQRCVKVRGMSRSEVCQGKRCVGNFVKQSQKTSGSWPTCVALGVNWTGAVN